MNQATYIKDKKNILILLYGFFSCMPLISFLGYTIFIWMCLVVLLSWGIEIYLNNSKIIYQRYCNWYLVIAIFSCISAVLCLNSSMGQIWKNGQLKNLALIVVYTLIFIMFATDKNITKAESFLKGLYYSALFQIFWGFLQLIFYKKGVLINDIIFVKILHMSTESVTQLKATGIALSGFCWNAANMAPLIAFAYVYTRKLSVKLVVILFSILCGNRTALIGIAFAVCLELLWRFIMSKLSMQYRYLVLMGVIIVIALLALICSTSLRNDVLNKMDKIFSIFSLSTLSTEGSASIHTRYLTSIPEIMGRSKIMHILFGYGLGNSGYPFTTFLGQWSWLDIGAWVVECEYVNWIWSTGIFGFLLMLSWILYYIYKMLKDGRYNRYLLFLLIILAQGFFYNIIFNWCLITIMCIIVVFENKRRIMSEIEYK